MRLLFGEALVGMFEPQKEREKAGMLGALIKGEGKLFHMTALPTTEDCDAEETVFTTRGAPPSPSAS
jgi:hypothetical protein